MVADIVRRLGVFIGDNLNEANDNLSFPGLDRIINVTADRVHPILVPEEVAEFEQLMNAGFRGHPECTWGWGWKNPPNYLFIEQFAAHFPHLRYLHVIRNGLDMALSSNTRQVQQWGHLFGVSYGHPTVVRSALDYWIKANDFAIEAGSSLLGDRFMLLNFDDLCRKPIPTIEALVRSLGLIPAEVDMVALASIVVSPNSIGRGMRGPNKVLFTEPDLQEVARFGFDVSS